MVKCAGTTADGHRCRSSAMAGAKYCYVHSNGKSGMKRRKASRSKVCYTRRVCRPLTKRAKAKAVDKAKCRPRSLLGRPMRRLPDGRVIPTVREYAMQFPESERKQAVEKYNAMSGCDLVNIAKLK